MHTRNEWVRKIFYIDKLKKTDIKPRRVILSSDSDRIRTFEINKVLHARFKLKYKKSLCILDHFLCTFLDIFVSLKAHLQSYFDENKQYSWHDIGSKLHIDHIKPIKYVENGKKPDIAEILKRLHCTNL